MSNDKRSLGIFLKNDFIKKLEVEARKLGISKNIFARTLIYEAFNKKFKKGA